MKNVRLFARSVSVILLVSLQALTGVAQTAAPSGGAKSDEAVAPNPADATLAAKAKAEPVLLAKAVSAKEVDGKSYDLVVVGGTAGGVACAVRASREGLTVLLVNHTRHLGGMMINGLMQWDALYAGHRAPILRELQDNIESYYKIVYGETSPDYQKVRFTQEHYPLGWAEPHVAEREFNRLIAGEKNITVLLAHYPTAIVREGAVLRSVTLREFGGKAEVKVQGKVFADATYEGDLLPLAKVEYRVGREARSEYGEPHAGEIYTNMGKGSAPTDAVEGRLNIRPYNMKQGTIDPTSPFSADGAVQAYNYRFCVSSDPANRIMLTEPPPGYNREEFVNYDRKTIASTSGPNKKGHMNSPILPGENHAYPEADWETREKITQRHLNFALGLVWFLQNDESVKEKDRAKFREWGLPKDEFADNNHVPYEMYVREARRLVGREVFTEHHNSLAKGYARTPISRESIGITDWYMDSHSCTTKSRPGCKYEGKLILTEESRPAQIPYGALLPKDVDNLLVPVCLSATHIAWGAVRLEPTWMQTGESAGWAAAMALKEGKLPGKLSGVNVTRALAGKKMLLSFFNDVEAGANESWQAAVQFFGTCGFFHDYNARLQEPLRASTAAIWAGALTDIQSGALNAEYVVKKVMESEATAVVVGSGGSLLSREEFTQLLNRTIKEKAKDAKPVVKALTRGEALEMMWGFRSGK